MWAFFSCGPVRSTKRSRGLKPSSYLRKCSVSFTINPFLRMWQLLAAPSWSYMNFLINLWRELQMTVMHWKKYLSLYPKVVLKAPSMTCSAVCSAVCWPGYPEESTYCRATALEMEELPCPLSLLQIRAVCFTCSISVASSCFQTVIKASKNCGVNHD